MSLESEDYSEYEKLPTYAEERQKLRKELGMDIVDKPEGVDEKQMIDPE